MLLRGSAHGACRVFGLVKWAQVSPKELLSLNEPQTVTVKEFMSQCGTNGTGSMSWGGFHLGVWGGSSVFPVA